MQDNTVLYIPTICVIQCRVHWRNYLVILTLVSGIIRGLEGERGEKHV